MAQQVGDFFESGAAVHQSTGQCVPQDVRASNAVSKTAALRCITYGIAYDIRIGRGVEWWAMSNKQLTASRLWPTILQILCDRSAGCVW